MESLEERIAKFLAVEEPEADGYRPVTPGNGTVTGEGGNMGNDVKAADIVYDGCGMCDGWGVGYAEDLDEAVPTVHTSRLGTSNGSMAGRSTILRLCP